MKTVFAVLAAEAVGDYVFYPNKLVQKEYTDNSNYEDEWCIYKKGGGRGTLVAITDEGHDHVSSFNSVEYYMNEMGYENIETLIDIDKSTFLEMMAMSNIFYCRAHGSRNGIALDGSLGLYTFSISTLNTYSNNVLDGCDLVVYGACLTAEGGLSSQNIASVTCAKGATTVIGFEISIICTETNEWAVIFFSRLSLGDTVNEAKNYADRQMVIEHPYTHTTDSSCIYGDKYQTFN